jgi:hypothetical protein
MSVDTIDHSSYNREPGTSIADRELAIAWKQIPEDQKAHNQRTAESIKEMEAEGERQAEKAAQLEKAKQYAKELNERGLAVQVKDKAAATPEMSTALDQLLPAGEPRLGHNAPNANENAVTAVNDAIAKDAVKPGDKPIDIKRIFDKMGDAFPNMKKFFSKIVGIFTDLAKNNTDTWAKAESSKLDSPDNKKIFDKYGIKTDKNVLDFGKGAEIKGERKTSGAAAGTELPKENRTDNKLTIDPNNTKSVTTKEENGKVVVTVIDNNDASNIYTVSKLSTTQSVKGVDNLVTNNIPTEKSWSSEG